MVQLVSKNSLAKKRINIRGRIIDTGYVENIITILQNNLEKAYIIEPNKKIAQTIFLSLVKIAQLISVGNKKKLGITNQVQIFKAEATICKSGKIGLVNLYIPAKNYSHIKIPIYNNTGDIIEILEETTIGYLTIEIKDQLPNTISDFPQLYGYVDIIS
ncbi:hypothetical protein G9A89_017169 [Geosiphon pyriformis]|nr:hypothetical protein G9A89_017169 [Geosiphon pyriformis]